MLEPIHWKGYFYSPDHPGDQLPGNLSFSQEEGIEVELFGQFKTYKNPASREENILLGFTANGKRITLLNCYESQRGMSIPGFPTSAFSARYMLVGKHFEKPEDIVFDQCMVEYRDINYWLNVSGFDKPVFNEAAKETIIRYVQPDKLSFQIKENWTLEIEFQYRRPWEYFVPINEAGISQEPAVFFKPAQRMHLHRFEEVYATFSSFLAMGYYTFPITEAITFYINKDETEAPGNQDAEAQRQPDEETEKDNIPEKVSLYYKSGLSYQKYKPHQDRSDFLFRYRTYADSFPALISQWYGLKETIDVTINVLTECFMDRGNPTESYFTSLTQALENMHRKLKRGKKTFNERLTAIVNGLPIKVKEAILHDETDFMLRVTNNRNYYTHYTVRGDFVPASLSELWVLSQKLKLILLAAVLQVTGFTNEQVEAMILKKGMYLFNHIINTSGMEEYLREINDKWD